jgi:hypothetical protein
LPVVEIKRGRDNNPQLKGRLTWSPLTIPWCCLLPHLFLRYDLANLASEHFPRVRL